MSGAAGPRRMDRRPLRQTHLSVDLHRLAFGLLWGIVLWCGVVLAGCSSVAQPSLYDRSGGEDGLAAIVDEFVGAVQADDRVSVFFTRTNIPRFKLLLADQLCAAAGGPCVYTGKDMKTAHHGLHITDSQFDAMQDDFMRSLTARGVPAPAQQEWRAIFAAMRGDIVGQ